MTLNNKNAEKPIFMLDFQPVPCYNERTKKNIQKLIYEGIHYDQERAYSQYEQRCELWKYSGRIQLLKCKQEQD